MCDEDLQAGFDVAGPALFDMGVYVQALDGPDTGPVRRPGQSSCANSKLSREATYVHFNIVHETRSLLDRGATTELLHVDTLVFQTIYLAMEKVARLGEQPTGRMDSKLPKRHDLGRICTPLTSTKVESLHDQPRTIVDGGRTHFKDDSIFQKQEGCQAVARDERFEVDTIVFVLFRMLACTCLQRHREADGQRDAERSGSVRPRGRVGLGL